jgi:hypothetical protein
LIGSLQRESQRNGYVVRVTNYREYIYWRWALSCVHSVMMVFLAQLAEEGQGVHAHPLSL